MLSTRQSEQPTSTDTVLRGVLSAVLVPPITVAIAVGLLLAVLTLNPDLGILLVLFAHGYHVAVAAVGVAALLAVLVVDNPQEMRWWPMLLAVPVTAVAVLLAWQMPGMWG